MKGIGGNMSIIILKQSGTGTNAIGEKVQKWEPVQSLWGWLDQLSGGTGYTAYNAKIQESTHVFISDYVPLAEGVTAENCRVKIGKAMYDVTLIDNPMELKSGSQLEIYLKYTGGQ